MVSMAPDFGLKELFDEQLARKVPITFPVAILEQNILSETFQLEREHNSFVTKTFFQFDSGSIKDHKYSAEIIYLDKT